MEKQHREWGSLWVYCLSTLSASFQCCAHCRWAGEQGPTAVGVLTRQQVKCMSAKLMYQSAAQLGGTAWSFQREESTWELVSKDHKAPASLLSLSCAKGKRRSIPFPMWACECETRKAFWGDTALQWQHFDKAQCHQCDGHLTTASRPLSHKWAPSIAYRHVPIKEVTIYSTYTGICSTRCCQWIVFRPN